MNGGYEMYVLRRLEQDAEGSRRHAGVAVREARWRRWLDRRAAAQQVVRIPGQRQAAIGSPSPEAVELTSSGS